MPIDPTSSVTGGYHLFLEPKAEIREQCQRIIRSLAEQYGGPVFVPHITLAACIEENSDDFVLERAARLAKELIPFQVTLGEFNGESAFFRALYVEIEDSSQLTQAHDRAHELFKLPPDTFQPHLSLFYGYLDKETYTAAQAEISHPKGSFIIDRIYVYRTQGTADMWEKIGECVFGT